ncbi:MAG: DMT family transporter [Pseudomonadota bacterium]
MLTCLAMVAFAANSILTRQALTEPVIDPVSFGTARVIAGALMLAVLVRLQRGQLGFRLADWPAAFALFGYVVFFSYAYLTLASGTGALILFGAVQITMFGWAINKGERLGTAGWFGLCLAFLGLVWLVLPGVTAPDLCGAAMMALAGIAWGVYSLRGQGAGNPLNATAINFIAVAPLMLLLLLAAQAAGADLKVSMAGLLLAFASGALASGCGYAMWYAALPMLGTGKAAIVQLSVPVIAAFGGVLLLAEPLTSRLLVASMMVLGGVLVALRQKER